MSPAMLRGGPLGRLGIGAKLGLGFGVLVILSLIDQVLIFWASERAATSIRRTTDALAPSALAAARAQANLLRMVGDVRGYLALGDRRYRSEYDQARQRFEANLVDLEALSGSDTAGHLRGIEELKAITSSGSAGPSACSTSMTTSCSGSLACVSCSRRATGRSRSSSSPSAR